MKLIFMFLECFGLYIDVFSVSMRFCVSICAWRIPPTQFVDSCNGENVITLQERSVAAETVSGGVTEHSLTALKRSAIL